jgi:hypothetical protein
VKVALDVGQRFHFHSGIIIRGYELTTWNLTKHYRKKSSPFDLLRACPTRISGDAALLRGGTPILFAL